MSLDEAIQTLRTKPEYSDLVLNTYLGSDIELSARQFSVSNECKTLLKMLDGDLQDKDVLDIGAGIGIASVALARNGAKRVFALEPDPSDLVGLAAMQKVIKGLPVVPIQSISEYIPLASNSVDIIYGRQVLHHIPDLKQALQECARVLRPGGRVIFCREPVVETVEELEQWLSTHPVHRLAGGENAYRLDEYVAAIEDAGLILSRQYNHFETAINYFPASEEKSRLNRQKIIWKRYGRIVSRLSRISLIKELIVPFLNPYFPGMLYTFEAYKRQSG